MEYQARQERERVRERDRQEAQRERDRHGKTECVTEIRNVYSVQVTLYYTSMTVVLSSRQSVSPLFKDWGGWMQSLRTSRSLDSCEENIYYSSIWSQTFLLESRGCIFDQRPALSDGPQLKLHCIQMLLCAWDIGSAKQSTPLGVYRQAGCLHYSLGLYGWPTTASLVL